MRKLSILNSLNQIDFGLFCPYKCAEITSNKCKYISKGSRDLTVGILLFGRYSFCTYGGEVLGCNSEQSQG